MIETSIPTRVKIIIYNRAKRVLFNLYAAIQYEFFAEDSESLLPIQNVTYLVTKLKIKQSYILVTYIFYPLNLFSLIYTFHVIC